MVERRKAASVEADLVSAGLGHVTNTCASDPPHRSESNLVTQAVGPAFAGRSKAPFILSPVAKCSRWRQGLVLF